ncbi:hypothetical protein GCM10011507_11500 [Edaphobacter acidisoli]|uniref:Nucleoside phosphorylase domain-containing protein n=1 Tax=Edaphobacter acidisoli TaxID=2040573 RepID=A0A916RMC4_9BACT|nr:phosphorylase [Edaphobacter acidisoli]GGA61662.1 hypothetical protein GCM10011507_11500 [Edaphobacter acidisoli]
MSECVGIIAALPREIKPLVRGWREERLAGRVRVYTKGSAVVACAGMGAARATLAVEAAMATKPITQLLSVGLAGACDPALRVGEMVRAGVVIDAKSGERYNDSRYSQVLVTAQVVAGVKEKRRLYESYGAAAVDMEAATVARLASARGVSFRAVKAISDEADFEMQDLARFATNDGQFRDVAFAAYAVVRPRLWGKVAVLARNSSRAVEALTRELQAILDLYQVRG